jgi:hypothetical protein
MMRDKGGLALAGPESQRIVLARREVEDGRLADYDELAAIDLVSRKK